MKLSDYPKLPELIEEILLAEAQILSFKMIDACTIDDSLDNEIDNVSSTAQSSALMKIHTRQRLHLSDKHSAIVRCVVGHEAAEYILKVIVLDCMMNLASNFRS